jgi:hypothetical protein
MRTRYGIPKLHPSPTLAQLVNKHLPQISSRHERVRATRLLNALLTDCGKSLPVNELHTSAPSDVCRSSQAMAAWDRPQSAARLISFRRCCTPGQHTSLPCRSGRPPKMPRPKVSKRRRERVIKIEE